MKKYPRNLYETLGVDPGADFAAIQAAYQVALAALPSDRFAGFRAWFGGRSQAQLHRAWRTLSEPRSRAEYDRLSEIETALLQFPPAH